MTRQDTLHNNLPTGAEIRYYPVFSTSCKLAHSPMTGRMEVIYKPDELLLELDSFEEWLATLCEIPTIAEQLCLNVHERLLKLLKPVSLSVCVIVTSASHSPIDVTIYYPTEVEE